MPSPLPKASGREVFSEVVPQPVLDISKPVAELTGTMEEIGTNIAVEQAEQAGSESVERDPATGKLRPVKDQLPLFAWNRAYNQAAHTAYMLESEGDFEQAGIKIAQQHADDPDGFRKAWAAYQQGVLGEAPPAIRKEIHAVTSHMGSQFLAGLARDKQKRDLADQLLTVQTGIESTFNQELAPLARGHGTDTPEFKAAWDRIEALHETLGSAPFNIGKAEIDKSKQGLLDRARAEAVLGQAEKVYRDKGAEAALEFVDESFRGTNKFNLPPDVLEHYRDMGDEIINDQEARRRARQADADRARYLDRQGKELASDAALNAVVKKLVADPRSVSAMDIANSAMDPRLKVEMVGKLSSGYFDRPVRTSGSVFNDLTRRIFLPDGDPRKITSTADIAAHMGVDLSVRDGNTLMRQLQGDPYEKNMKSALFKNARSQLTRSDPMTGMRDAKGDEHFYQFQAWFMETYAERRAAGVSVHDLLDPNGKEYLGKGIERYQRTPQEQMADLMRANPGVMQGVNVGAVPPPARQASPLAAPPKAFDTSKADRTATGPNGQKAYHIGGSWFYADGRKVQ